VRIGPPGTGGQRDHPTREFDRGGVVDWSCGTNVGCGVLARRRSCGFSLWAGGHHPPPVAISLVVLRVQPLGGWSSPAMPGRPFARVSIRDMRAALGVTLPVA
jgi:hypothetical protein